MTFQRFSKIDLPSEKPVQFDKHYDAVIVGCGAAGIAAAIEAREAGLEVCIIDRFAGGGATAASGGVVYAGGGTVIQKKLGEVDTPDNMFAYLRQEVGPLIDDEHLRDFCAQSAETIDWLIARNVRFGDTVYKHKTSYPGASFFLYHSDNSLVPSYAETANPAARGHRGWVPVEQGKKAINLGGSIFNPLRAHAEAIGVEILPYSEARQLVWHNGRISGIKLLQFPSIEARSRYAKLRAEAERLMQIWPPILPGGRFFFQLAKRKLAEAQKLADRREPIYVGAERGVVLCAGGFGFNKDMMAHYAPAYRGGYPLGTEGDDGAGIELGLSVGGAVENMSRASAWRFINPPLSFARGMIVNKDAQRFINEMLYGAHIGSTIAEEQDGKAWLILNRQLVKEALREVGGGRALAFQRDLARLNIWFGAKKAKTIENLAATLNISPTQLVETWRSYCASDTPIDQLGKAAADRGDLSSGPFYAINVGLTARLFPCPVLTLGGLQVDQKTGAVLGSAGVIPGLYAAGRNALGICAANYVSGLSIADGLYSGRRAGRSLNRESF